ncbi:MAG TPA: copper resistance protein CopC [Candidatus Limnocylindria bacterium]|nr:copper resistance protein CopC [Candidatus Limnocylindria bacterium]
MFRLLAARRRQLLAAAALAALLSAPGVVLAHAELTSAVPAPNGAVATSPDAVELRFTETIDPSTAGLDLLDSQGRAVAGVGAVSVDDDELGMRASLPDLEPGVYTVSYRIVSSVDGHATEGVYAFLVDPTGAAPPPADSARTTSPSVDGFTVAARWVALAAILVALGSMLMWAASARPALESAGVDAAPPWRLVVWASLAAAGGVAAYLLLAARPIGDDGTGIPFDIGAAFGWTPFAIAMRVTFVACLVAAAIGFLARGRGGPRAWLAIALLVIAVGATSVAGHVASTGGPLVGLVDSGHLVGVATWLGGLPAALVLAARGAERRAALAGTILRRHGPVALVAAPLVAVTGIVSSPLVAGSARDVVASDYGNLLVAKAILLSVALGIGAVNHLVLRGRGRATVATLVGAELAVAALAVGAAATMVTIQPASARAPVLAGSTVRPAHFFGEVGPSRVHLAVSLPAPGTQSYRVTVRDAESGAPRDDVQRVFLELAPPVDLDLPDERIELEPDPDTGGLWVTSGAYTPVAGEWTATVVVRRQGQRDEELPFALTVEDPGAAELGPPPDTGINAPPPLEALWRMLPGGPAAWLPAAAALAGLAGLWALRPSIARDAMRGALAAVFVVTTLAAGSRSLVLAANAPSATDLAAQSPLPAVTDLDRGRRIYLANCASCHGTDLRGGTVSGAPPPPPLDAAVADASDAELSYRIAQGVAGTAMPSFAGLLTPDERADLIGYLRAHARGTR